MPGSHVRLTPPLVPMKLRDYGNRTRAAVAERMDADQPAPYLTELLADYLGRAGKMMRPSICIAAARATGGALEDALPGAAAVEMFHTGLLIHDDVQDHSETRRGRPTLHAMHGVPLAVNAGDAMLLRAIETLTELLGDLSPLVSRAILAATLRMARETAEGQALELGWRDMNRLDVEEADYLTMVLKKTAWMSIIWPMQVGMLIGSGGAADPERPVRFGFFLGAAFQIQDDLLNLRADAAYGKERMGDLYEGKRTLMLIHARRHAKPAERRRIDAFLALPRQERHGRDVADVMEVMERTGAIEHGRAYAAALAGAAQREFAVAFADWPDSEDRRFLEGLVPWVFERI